MSETDCRFEESPEHAKALEKLMAVASKLGRGDTLTHSMIENATGYQHLSPDYYYIVHRWQKRTLADRGIATMEEKSVGWHLCTKDDQIGKYERKRAAKAQRQIRKARRALVALDDRELNAQQRRLKHLKLDIQKQSLKAIRAKAELRAVFNKPRLRNPIIIPKQQPQPVATV